MRLLGLLALLVALIATATARGGAAMAYALEGEGEGAAVETAAEAAAEAAEPAAIPVPSAGVPSSESVIEVEQPPENCMLYKTGSAELQGCVEKWIDWLRLDRPGEMACYLLRTPEERQNCYLTTALDWQCRMETLVPWECRVGGMPGTSGCMATTHAKAWPCARAFVAAGSAVWATSLCAAQPKGTKQRQDCINTWLDGTFRQENQIAEGDDATCFFNMEKDVQRCLDNWATQKQLDCQTSPGGCAMTCAGVPTGSPEHRACLNNWIMLEQWLSLMRAPVLQPSIRCNPYLGVLKPPGALQACFNNWVLGRVLRLPESTAQRRYSACSLSGAPGQQDKFQEQCVDKYLRAQSTSSAELRGCFKINGTGKRRDCLNRWVYEQQRRELWWRTPSLTK